MPILLLIGRYTKEPQKIPGKYPNSVKSPKNWQIKTYGILKLSNFWLVLSPILYFLCFNDILSIIRNIFSLFLKVTPQKRPQKLTKHKGEKKSNRVSSILHSKCEKAKVGVKKLVGLCFLSPLAGSRNNCVNSKMKERGNGMLFHTYFGVKNSLLLQL